MKSLFTKVARAVGFETEHAESPEFTRKLCDFNTHVSDLQRVRDALQLYSDSMEAMLAAQVVLGDALDTYYRSSMQASYSSEEQQSRAASSPTPEVTSNGAAVREPIARAMNNTIEGKRIDGDDTMMHHNIAKLYKKYGHHMHSTMRPVLHEVFISRCIRPVNYILARVPSVHDRLARRKKLIHDFDEVQSQFSREKQQSQKSMTLESKLSEIQNEIQDNNHDLMLSLDEFAVSRPLMLRQEFSAMIACSYHHVNSAVSQLGQLLPLLPQSASSMCLLQAADQFDTEMLGQSDRANKIKVILERAKVEGGQTGGYGVGELSSREERGRRATSTEATQAGGEPPIKPPRPKKVST